MTIDNETPNPSALGAALMGQGVGKTTAAAGRIQPGAGGEHSFAAMAGFQTDRPNA